MEGVWKVPCLMPIRVKYVFTYLYKSVCVVVGQGKDRGMLFCFTLCCMDLENGDGCKSTFGMQLGENDRPTESLVTTKVWLSKYCLAKSVNELAWVRHKKFTSKVLHIHSMHCGLTSFLK